MTEDDYKFRRAPLAHAMKHGGKTLICPADKVPGYQTYYRYVSVGKFRALCSARRRDVRICEACAEILVLKIQPAKFVRWS